MKELENILKIYWIFNRIENNNAVYTNGCTYVRQCELPVSNMSYQIHVSDKGTMELWFDSRLKP